MRDILWPETDRGVYLQAVIVVVLTAAVVYGVRRERSLVTLTVGLGMCVLGLIGVRALH